jgi:mono/diheme cytochrome c family protein/glucose/arabinose dehydrogenase
MKRASVLAGLVLAGITGLTVAIGGQAGTATTPGNPWPPARKATPTSPALSAEDEMKSFSVPPGFHVELVASEPMIESPILVDWDADGRLYVLEMLSFLPDLSGRDSPDPINRVSVLEDTDHDGKMDKKTIFADGLRMPRALKVLDKGGVLVGEPPNLWYFQDTDGDLKADKKELITDTYGNPNAGIEHNANSTFWAMDNIMYSSEHTRDLRWKNGKFETLPALSRGQWQVSQDDAGRLYRNVNDAPIYVDYTPSRYFLRNPDVVRTRGLYELLIEQMDATVYPVRPNRGVNRGYRDSFFRADGSSTVIQGAGTPTIYRGDRYPKDLQGDAFITDSPTNLVHRMKIVDDGTGKLTAKNGYPRGEFLASSDERFRPVSLSSAPDGTMYVVDMYRGVVQAGGIWSEYLTDYIKAHDLQLPVAKGRIWRLVYGNGPNARGPQPSLSSATPAQLVQTLSHPNGWWRDTAQQLLVQRHDLSVVPQLTTAAGTAPDWRTRLQALWTLDGLDAIEPAVVLKAFADVNPNVRAAGVRISERWMSQPDQPVVAAALKLIDDKSWTVRRQLAASIGELPTAARIAPAVTILTREGADPIITDAVVSGLKDLEGDVLNRVLQARPAQASGAPARAASARPTEAVSILVAAVSKSGDVAGVQKAIDLASNAATPSWERTALLQGLDMAMPAVAARGAGRGVNLAGLSAPGGRVVVTPGRGITLPAEPAALMKLASGTGDLATLALMVSNKLDWPGRPAPKVVATPLTADQQKRMAVGAEIYKNVCLGCHQEDGRGKDKVAANLVDSAYVNGGDLTPIIRILLSGKEGQIGLMPPVGPAMNDEQIAGVITYIRRSWGHAGTVPSPLEVGEIRALTKARNKPWTDPELQAPARGFGGGRGRGAGGPGGGRGNAPSAQ